MTKEQAIQQAIDFLDGSYEAHAVRKALQQALAQPEQEPVAFMAVSEDGVCEEISHIEHHYDGVFPDIDDLIPLYTHPAPTKEWVGLSYEEADGLILQYQHAPFKFVRAIEQALKEKNYG